MLPIRPTLFVFVSVAAAALAILSSACLLFAIPEGAVDGVDVVIGNNWLTDEHKRLGQGLK